MFHSLIFISKLISAKYVVTKQEAQLAGLESLPLRGNHIEISSCSSKTDPNYIDICSDLVDMVKNIEQDH
jgi:hypothetical protein